MRTSAIAAAWCGLALLLAGATHAQSEAPLIGRASVIDADTIEVQGERVRLNGIDAPEGRQHCSDADAREYRCGQVAAAALDDFLASARPVICDFVERDRYGRFVGVCRRSDGSDVQAWLVENGHALDWPRYSGGQYASHQLAAQQDGRGMWQGSFVAPWDWRRGER